MLCAGSRGRVHFHKADCVEMNSAVLADNIDEDGGVRRRPSRTVE